MNEPKRLDWRETQSTVYAVPLWLRDQQILSNIAAVKDRITPEPVRTDPIAVVCFGPTLNDTWEKIRDFKYVITCSGSHKFLLERGIVPQFHVEVDPREHKIILLGKPHPAVTYLIASTCHPKLISYLQEHNANLKLWHVFANEAEAIRTLPKGEWALTGGSSAGLRAMTIARFLGFTKLEIFGMDGNQRDTEKHAAPHPLQPKDFSLVEYEGVTYRTTAAMLETAKGTFHELDEMPDVVATFHGDGMIQHMARHYTPKVKGKGFIGFNMPELISPEYVELNRQLHKENLAYGVGDGKYADTVLKIAKNLVTEENPFVSILNYGCGKGLLAKALPFPIAEYDPAIPGKTESPRPADLVCCFDVLEHIEPDKLKLVLGDLCRCVKKLGYFVVHTGPAGKTLPDGRNTHLIQEGSEWWKDKLRKFFTVPDEAVKAQGPLLHIVVAPKVKVNSIKQKGEVLYAEPQR